MKVTKESLIAENAVLKANIEAAKAEKDNIAHYLSVALGAGTRKKSDYGNETEQIVYLHQIRNRSETPKDSGSRSEQIRG